MRSVFAVVLALSALGCGSGSGSKRAVECRSYSDCDASELGVCGTVTCEDNRCVDTAKPDGHRCDDEDALTGEDACLDGICAGVVKECDDDLGPCLRPVFDAETGECVVEPVEDGTDCDDSDACTSGDACQAGECQGGERKTCEAADACHVEGECDPESGECKDVAAPDGTGCDDGLVCTTDDACQAGSCAGAAVACADELACSVDSCDEVAGGCVADMAGCACEVDADCQDDNACNGVEQCDPTAKLCQAGRAVVCQASDDPCLQNSCVPETGECQPEPVVDGTACDDASACTGRDTCQEGVCVGSNPVVCAALSQCHQAGSCDPITGACSNPEKADTTPCSDGNACTPNDACLDGACVGSGSVTCTASDQCHDPGVCNPQTGGCSNPAKTDGVSCNDGNACTSGDACQAGSCSGPTQKACDAIDSCHSPGVCNPQTGACSTPAKPDGTTCEDGQLCTTSDACVAGKCQGSGASCDDGLACSVDSCSEALGGCTSDSSACSCNTSADCNDKNPCNGVEVCNLQTKTCQSGTAVDCSNLNDGCNVGTCSAATGACVATPKENGTSCDDGDLCSQASSCQAGVCKGSSPVTCAALDQCHDAGTCNPKTGKCSDPAKDNGAACNDGSACTKTDSCQGGVCTGSDTVVCKASDQCHQIGTCDPSTGVCSDPAKSNGSGCSDGSLCSQTDTCQGGVCVGGSPVTCSAKDQCHSIGSCDPDTGACSDPAKKDGTACSDGDSCTQTDTCQAGVCGGANPVKCTALDQCHVAGTCDPDTGACSDPAKMDGSTCSDGSLCTQTDTCKAGVCSGGNPKACPASDQCHNAGSCDGATGTCSNPAKPDKTPCDDGKACTSTDQCTTGVCGGAAVTCADDGIACTTQSCGEPAGCTTDYSKCGCDDDKDCDDGDPCNGAEKCDLGSLSCKAGTSVDCSGSSDACNVGTCDRTTGACKKVPKMDGTTCDDGSACTRSDSCAAGACKGTDPVVCPTPDQCHNAGTCDAATGVCSNPAKNDGATCDDKNACTKTDTCQMGSCTGADPVVCPTPDQCHNAGTCNTKTGVCSNPAKNDGVACNDGDKCTQTDTCQTGACSGGNPVVCSALDQCHDVGKCAPATGVCSDPAKANGEECDDSNKCTGKDTCQSGACSGADPVVCIPLAQCYDAGTCDKGTGACSNPYTSAGTSCNDGNACISGEKCDGKGACKGGSAVVCPPPTDQCKTNTCDTGAGCKPGDQPDGWACDPSNACYQAGFCITGACQNSDRRSNRADWTDDPGGPSVGPTSVDTFGDRDGNAVIVGTYHGTIRFEDKEVPKTAKVLGLGQFGVGIYWAVYPELGGQPTVANIGAGSGSLAVHHAAGHSDGSFSLLGTLQGSVTFGLGAKGQTLEGKNLLVWVAHYKADGNLEWLAQFQPGDGVKVSANSIAAFDDQSVIAIGAVGGGMTFIDGKGTSFDKVDAEGVWAARLGPDGAGHWARLVVVFPDPKTPGSASAHAVTTHDDGSASLTGAFSGSAFLGPKGETRVSVSAEETGRTPRDIWFERLDKDGAFMWGGRVGGLDIDVPGDVARIKGGGTLLLANTRGASANANDLGSTLPLYTTSTASLQAHVLALDAAGNLESAGLIAGKTEGDTQGYQIKLDPGGMHAVAGTFSVATAFYSKIGFGSGGPPGSAKFPLTSQGVSTLFVARTNEGAGFDWAVQAGGDTSGMTEPPSTPISPWDIVMTGHESHSLTLAGMFKAESYFGDQAPELLQADAEVGNPFVVHLNTEAEYDYCPFK